MFRNKILSFFIALSIAGCQHDKKVEITKDSLFELIPSEVSGITFTNKLANEKGLNVFLYRNFYNGGGVAIGDINNDGLADIYLTSNMDKNKLFLNMGNFTFKDITASSGTGGEREWTTGVSMVDINGDGLLDIYVCNAGNGMEDDRKNELFINNGDLTFSEKAEEYGLDDNGLTTHAVFFDYDADGDLDAFILNNSFIPANSLGYSNMRSVRSENWDVPEMLKGGGDKLLRNENGKFKDVSEEAGIYGSLMAFGMGVTVGDINQDMLPDIYVSNDFYERDYLYINNGDGTFKESIKDYMGHISLSSMGTDMADINNDGFSDICVIDMLPEGDTRLKRTTDFENYDIYNLKVERDFYHQFLQNTLQLNNGNETFSEIAFYSGVAQTDWSWGPLIFDMDNDGYLDIFVTNGIYQDLTDQDFIDFFANKIVQKMIISGIKEEVDSIFKKMPSVPLPNYSFKNNGDLTFTNRSTEWGLDIPSFSNGSAYGDLDNDGDLDLIVNNVNQPCFAYKNNSSEKTGNNYLKVRLKGEGKNTFGIGSVVYVYFNGQPHKQELVPSRGFQSSVDPVLNFGLGKATMVDSIKVIWPNHETQVIKNISGGQLLTLDIIDATKKEISIKRSKSSTEKLVDAPFYPHKENSYVDFDYEGLITQMLSREGPPMAVADLNNDGRDDVFIGGATGYPGQIYLQSPEGKMILQKNDCFEKDKNYEDTAASFFDADGDGDMDLYVGSGGNDKESESELLKDRLYNNNGKGAFEKAIDAIPDFRYNTSVVAPCDFDLDNDIDLFAGSLSVSRIYGINPRHYLLENDGHGKFKDITEARAYKFRNMGMVTDAVWQDLDSDGFKDLVVVGQWMAPVIYHNSGHGLSPVATSLDTLSGWWNAVSVADMDNDGDMDMIFGNRGDNTYIKASSAAPVKMFVNDFDNNGSIEQILTRYTEGKDKPIPLKRELVAQLPHLLKNNMTFAEYAENSIYDLLPADLIKNSIKKEVNISESIVAYNEGGNKFRIEPLPKEIQFTCVNKILITDLNGDNFKDIILGENNYNFKPQFGRLDAGFAHLIMGSDSGFVKPELIGTSGQGAVRSIKEIAIKKQKYIILGINNERSKLYKIKK
jgi:enediyne biosynthesis protein E4